MARTYVKKGSVTASVDAIGKALGELLSAYEAQGAAITAAQHNKVFNHLRSSLTVIQDKCENARTLGAITGGGFSLDGPEADFIGSAEPVPVQRIAAAIAAKPILVRSPVNPVGVVKATAAQPPVGTPVGRLSKHSPDPDAGQVLTFTPPVVQQAPPNVPDEPEIDFIEDK